MASLKPNCVRPPVNTSNSSCSPTPPPPASAVGYAVLAGAVPPPTASAVVYAATPVSPVASPPGDAPLVSPVASPPVSPVASPPGDAPPVSPVASPPGDAPTLSPVASPPGDTPPVSPVPPPTASPPVPAIVVPPVPSTNSTAPPPTSPNGGLPPWKLALMVGIGIWGLIVLVGVCIFLIFYWRKRRRRLELGSYSARLESGSYSARGPKVGPSSVPSPGMALGLSPNTFKYEELKIATHDFSPHNLLGQGGFGYVHKGVLSSGKVVAIKQLKAESPHGEKQFRAEVEIISRIHHRHLVSLVGYCISGAHRILVYEFVPNSTLEFHLHGKDQPTMDWSTRMKIALGSARGLAYLHEECNPKIIHRDIKAANILLESNFEAKILDLRNVLLIQILM